MARIPFPLLVLALAAMAGAQPFAGTYHGATDVGPAVVVFQQEGAALTGTLEAPGLAFGLSGEVRDGVAYGQVHTGQGTAGFEAHVQGDALGLYLYEFDAAGGVAAGSVIELVLERAVAAAPAAPALGGLRSANPAAPTTPSEPAATGGSPVLAVGAHGQLTEDAAHAFLEALEFVLAQIGAPYAFPEAERRAALEELARSFPLADPDEQRVLADARFVWTQVRANWASASLEAQREFALGVLALAFGEEAVRAWVGEDAGGGASAGGGSAGGGSDGCGSFDECAGAYVDGQTWSDTFNTQSCWAAAGCSSFDTSTGTFEYD